MWLNQKKMRGLNMINSKNLIKQLIFKREADKEKKKNIPKIDPIAKGNIIGCICHDQTQHSTSANGL